MSVRDKFLNVPLDTVLHPTSEFVQQGAVSTTPLQFNSCFISSSTKDEAFVQMLHDDLTPQGVECWYAPYDIRGGEKIVDQIHNAIQLKDKLLLILSEHSI